MNPRPDIQEELIKPYKEMEDVYSLSCVVGDAMEREQVMRHDMKPKSINKKIIGPAITVKLTAGDIVDCLCVFEIARPGDVIVIDAFGETETSIWGGLMSGLARNAGIAGAVIDGSCRDTDEAKEVLINTYYIAKENGKLAKAGELAMRVGKYFIDRKDEEQATYYLNEGIKLFNESEKVKTNK